MAAIDPYAAYLRAKNREDSAYRELAERLQRIIKKPAASVTNESGREGQEPVAKRSTSSLTALAGYCIPLQSNVVSRYRRVLAGSGSLLLIQRPFQTALLITAADVYGWLEPLAELTPAMRGAATPLASCRSAKGTKNDPNLLSPTAEDLGERLLIFLSRLGL